MMESKKMEQMLFSIIVPIYGVEKYLRKCLNSIINQSYFNIEIILVDDGSKDNCPMICDEFAKNDNRIKVIHKTNGGLVSARKAGIKAANGEYIICVDGDDWISQDYVDSFYNVIIKYHPDLICCGLVTTDGVNEKNKMIALDFGYYDVEKIREKIYPIAIESEYGYIFPPQLCSKAIKKELYVDEQMALDDKVCIGEDGAVTKPMLTKCSSLYILDKCIYYYRMNLASLTKNKKGYDWAGPDMIYNHLRKRINNSVYDFNDQIERKIAHDIYIVVVSYFQTGKPYREIKKEIIDNIEKYNYRTFLYKCKFKSAKIKLEIFIIRHFLFFPIYLMKK